MQQARSSSNSRRRRLQRVLPLQRPVRKLATRISLAQTRLTPPTKRSMCLLVCTSATRVLVAHHLSLECEQFFHIYSYCIQYSYGSRANCSPKVLSKRCFKNVGWCQCSYSHVRVLAGGGGGRGTASVRRENAAQPVQLHGARCANLQQPSACMLCVACFQCCTSAHVHYANDRSAAQ